MNQLKERVETEDKELLAKGKDFLEETLRPMAECNNRKRKKKFGMIGTVCCVCLLLGSSIGIGIVYKNLFAATYETKSSDVTYLNSTLTHTQVTGEFDSISLMYEKRHDRPIYFLGIYEREEAETSYTNVRINVIIDRGYTMEKTSYSKALDFLEYSVEYTDTEVIEDSGEFVLHGYHVEGYIDTGAERYKIDYIEYRINDNNYQFAEYLQKTIKQKGA